MKKQYTHNCKCCKFLGQYQEFDLYIHKPYDFKNMFLIARYGNKKYEKREGTYHAAQDPIIAIAAVRAICLGKLTAETIQFHWSKHFEKVINSYH